jgi:hypothetical protein
MPVPAFESARAQRLTRRFASFARLDFPATSRPAQHPFSMSTSPSASTSSPTPSLGPSQVWLLRLEGLGIALLSAILYARTGASWWLFAALWLVPDLGMLGYLAGPRWGAIVYNMAHWELLPALLAAGGLLLPAPYLLPSALIWFNHIGVDRLLGYGLKSSTSFGSTHLQSKRPKSERVSA